MPYRDPAKRRAVQRESQARRRGAYWLQLLQLPPLGTWALHSLLWPTKTPTRRARNREKGLRVHRAPHTAKSHGADGSLCRRNEEARPKGRRLFPRRLRHGLPGGAFAAPSWPPSLSNLYPQCMQSTRPGA